MRASVQLSGREHFWALLMKYRQPDSWYYCLICDSLYSSVQSFCTKRHGVSYGKHTLPSRTLLTSHDSHPAHQAQKKPQTPELSHANLSLLHLRSFPHVPRCVCMLFHHRACSRSQPLGVEEAKALVVPLFVLVSINLLFNNWEKDQVSTSSVCTQG